MTPSSSFSDPAVALELGRRLASNARRDPPATPARAGGFWGRLFARRHAAKRAAARG